MSSQPQGSLPPNTFTFLIILSNFTSNKVRIWHKSSWDNRKDAKQPGFNTGTDFFQHLYCLRLLGWNQFLMTKIGCCFLLFSKQWFLRVYAYEEKTFTREGTPVVMWYWRVTRKAYYKVSGVICHHGKPGSSGWWEASGNQVWHRAARGWEAARAELLQMHIQQAVSWNGALSLIISILHG